MLPSSSTGHGEFTAKIGAALCIYIPSTASRLEMVVRGAYWISSNSSFISNIAIAILDFSLLFPL